MMSCCFFPNCYAVNSTLLKDLFNRGKISFVQSQNKKISHNQQDCQAPTIQLLFISHGCSCLINIKILYYSHASPTNVQATAELLNFCNCLPLVLIIYTVNVFVFFILFYFMYCFPLN